MTLLQIIHKIYSYVHVFSWRITNELKSMKQSIHILLIWDRNSIWRNMGQLHHTSFLEVLCFVKYNYVTLIRFFYILLQDSMSWPHDPTEWINLQHLSVYINNYKVHQLTYGQARQQHHGWQRTNLTNTWPSIINKDVYLSKDLAMPKLK